MARDEAISLENNGASLATVESILEFEGLKHDRIRTHKSETEQEVSRRESILEILRDQRQKARLELCARLGDFGFAYDPENHAIVRIGLVDPPEPEPVATPAPVREPFDPRVYGVEEAPREDPSRSILKVIDILMWCVVPFLGAFLGYSIGILAGLRVNSNLWLLVASILFGIALLSAMKGAVYSIACFTARKAESTGVRAWVWLGGLVCLLLICAEAGLGMSAIHHYSLARAEMASEVMPLWQALLIAVCFATPMLLTSALKGNYEGSGIDDSHRDRARRDAERFHEETAAATRAKYDEEQRQVALAKERQAAAMVRYEEANARYRDDDRWKTAMSLYGAIPVLDKEIEEREALLTSYKISRGYKLSEERKQS